MFVIFQYFLRAVHTQNESLRYYHDVRPSVCPSVHLSETGVHCDHTVHFSTDLSLWLDSSMFWAPDIKACPPTPSRLFPVPPETEVGMHVHTRPKRKH